MTQSVPNDVRLKWWKKLLYLPLFPLLPLLWIGILLLAVCLSIMHPLYGRWRAWRLYTAMQKAGRVSTWEEIEAALSTGGCTLIYEYPSMGWCDLRVWWTPDSIQSLATTDGIVIPEFKNRNPSESDFASRLDDPAYFANPLFDRWCRDRYLDPSNSNTKFVQATYSGRAERAAVARLAKLKATYPDLETVDIYSGIVSMADKGKK